MSLGDLASKMPEIPYALVQETLKVVFLSTIFQQVHIYNFKKLSLDISHRFFEVLK
mgnify:FL=1